MMKITRCIMSRLLKLFASQKWARALKLLSSNRRKLWHKIQKEFSANNKSTSSSFNKRSEDDDPFTSIRNLLPAAIAYRAPTNVLKAIIYLNPNILWCVYSEFYIVLFHETRKQIAPLASAIRLLYRCITQNNKDTTFYKGSR